MKEHVRFKEILKEHLKKNLEKIISHEDIIKGNQKIRIPFRQLKIPTFEFYRNYYFPENLDGGAGGAGDKPGEHALEIEIDVEELVSILEEELELPRIKPKGKDELISPQHKYTAISKAGPESLRHFRRTYRAALKTAILSNQYDPKNPKVIPIKEDKRYKYIKKIYVPLSNAVVFYIMDVSGSMGEDQLRTVKSICFWTEAWLKRNYKNIKIRYIQHDIESWEVFEREKFYKTTESGGTRISSALSLLEQIINKEYPGDYWNLYAFQYSDGDNLSDKDNTRCIEIMRKLLTKLNLFCYGQVKPTYIYSHNYMNHLTRLESENLIIADLNSENLIEVIKKFLGKGK